MKYLIGFFLGLWLAAAFAQSDSAGRHGRINADPFPDFPDTTLLAGTGPSGKAAAIHVNVDGYVICSDHHKGETK